MKNRKKMLIIPIIIILLFIGVYYCNKNKSSDIFLKYGDDIKSVNIVNMKNEKNTLEDNESEYKVLFLLNTKCGSCYEYISNIKSLDSILPKDKIRIFSVWNEKVRKQKLFKNMDNINYYIKGSNILNGKPCFAIINNGKIEFITEDFESLIMKIMALDDNLAEKIKANAAKYLVENLKTKKFENKKDDLIIFSMKGCKDCTALSKEIEREKLYEKYNIMEFYDKEAYGEYEFVDENNLFLYIYDIDWYPTFLKVDRNDEYQLKSLKDYKNQGLYEIFEK